ncbi:MAG: aminotransferase class III-fold pyridoxal phosphate-dependent enzyme [Deferrisomatales bacterium]|nr:aminotransferase class III-fold pyridoxal phosphate-dependent enzyme [Deferrisomatales bacterium]
MAEPVVGATAGVLVPPDGYWQRIRAICDRYGILLIADEVMTGAGRTDRNLALQHWGVEGDLTVLAKGLSSGYAPIGAVLVRRSVHEAIRGGSGSFTHGHTYGQHPVSMAIGAAVLRYLEEHRLVERSAALGQRMLEALQGLADLPLVGDVRGLGLFAGVELVADKATREPFDPRRKMAYKVAAEAMARGLVTYPGDGGADGIRGDHLLLSPPLTVTEEELVFLVGALGEALEAAHETLPSP